MVVDAASQKTDAATAAGILRGKGPQLAFELHFSESGRQSERPIEPIG